MHHSTGLRERKKAETRSAIGKAVMHLAIDRGFDAVTAEDIATTANVSVRTVHNYFSSKEEALVDAWRTQFECHLDELRARPADEPTLVSLEHVFAGIAEKVLMYPKDAAVQADLLWTSTVMAQRRSVVLDEAVKAVTAIVAERTHTDPEVDVHPHVVTAAAIAVTVTTLQFALRSFNGAGETSPPDVVAMLHRGFALLRTGLDELRPASLSNATAAAARADATQA